MSLNTNQIILQLELEGETLLGSFNTGIDRIVERQPINLDISQLEKVTGLDEYGQVLTEMMIRSEIGAAFQQQIKEALQAGKKTRIRLLLADFIGEEFQNVRWESWKNSATDGVPFAAMESTSFSRLVNLAANISVPTPRVNLSLKMIVAISNPSNLQPKLQIQVEKEKKNFEEALRPLRGLVQYEFVEPPVTIDRIFEAVKQQQPAIFHFLGHGTIKDDKKHYLALEEADTGEVKLISEDEWFQRLKMLSNPPHLVVLAACESADIFQNSVGIAPRTIAAGVGAVVAMQGKVGMEPTREFTRYFYTHLARHGEIDLAVNEARSYLSDQGLWSLSSPTIWLQLGAEQIFDAPEPLEVKPAQSGETLILIADFKGDAEDLKSETVWRSKLQKQIDEANFTRVRVEALRKNFEPGDDAAALQLATRYEATLIIWGWYDLGNFEAHFTLSELRLADRDPAVFQSTSQAEKLWELGANTRDKDFVSVINTKLPQQVEFFVFFTLAQSLYWDLKYEQALQALSKAIDVVKIEPPQGLTYAYFYRGNLYAIHRQDRLAAIEDYKQALNLQPDFASAAYCLGQSQRILGNTYREAKDTTNAKLAYESAIKAYDQALGINKDYAPAYVSRGLAYWNIGRLSIEPEKRQRAFEDAKKAYQLALEGQPQAATFNRLSVVLMDLKDWEEAQKQFEQAIKYAPRLADTYFNRGQLFKVLGNTRAAIEDFEKYLSLAPNHKYQDTIKTELANLRKTNRQEQENENFIRVIIEGFISVVVNENNGKPLSTPGGGTDPFYEHALRILDEPEDDKINDPMSQTPLIMGNGKAAELAKRLSALKAAVVTNEQTYLVEDFVTALQEQPLDFLKLESLQQQIRGIGEKANAALEKVNAHEGLSIKLGRTS